jgi:hypothetical protein
MQKAKALKALHRLEKSNSKKLDKRLKNLCDDYAINVFGHIKYVYWLYVYAYIAKEFKPGWIPTNYYVEYVVKDLKGLHGLISGLKSINRILLDSKFFPDIGSYINGLFLDENGLYISESEISQRLFEDTSVVVFKQDLSERGLKIHFFTSTNFDSTKIRKLGNGVFQSYVKQHPDLALFSSTSVSTLRITTISTDTAEVQVRSSNFKVAPAGATHVEATSFVRVAVDIQTGKYLLPAYNFDWSIATKKDYCGEDFEDKYFPKFLEACELVLELHRKIPFVRSIGWDVVVDEEGEVKILEWNGYSNGINFDEATQGPCFADLGWENMWRLNKARS